MAVSITDPPPTATNASIWRSRAKSMACWNDSSVGSTRTWSYSSNSTPLSCSDCNVRATAGSVFSSGSVSTSTRRVPIPSRSIPISRVTPQPNRMLDAAISKAISWYMELPILPSPVRQELSHPRGELPSTPERRHLSALQFCRLHWNLQEVPLDCPATINGSVVVGFHQVFGKLTEPNGRSSDRSSLPRVAAAWSHTLVLRDGRLGRHTAGAPAWYLRHGK